MMRHKAARHPDASEEDETDQGEEEDSEDETQMNDSKSSGSEEDSEDERGGGEDDSEDENNRGEDEEEDSEAETDEDTYNIWMYLKNSALRNKAIESQFDEIKANLASDESATEEEVNKHALRVVKPDIFKHVCKHYAAFLKLWHWARENKYHKEIMKTKRKLMDEEDFDYEEAIEHAVKKRKYLIEKATGIGLFDDEPLDEVVPPPIADEASVDEDSTDED